jgi:hypothetical protein
MAKQVCEQFLERGGTFRARPDRARRAPAREHTEVS